MTITVVQSQMEPTSDIEETEVFKLQAKIEHDRLARKLASRQKRIKRQFEPFDKNGEEAPVDNQTVADQTFRMRVIDALQQMENVHNRTYVVCRAVLPVSEEQFEAFRERFKSTSRSATKIFNTGRTGERTSRIQTPIHHERMATRATSQHSIIHGLMERLNRIVQVLLPSHTARNWVVLESLPECLEQHPHHDFVEDEVLEAVSKYGESAMPYAIVFALSDNAILYFWDNDTSSKRTEHLFQGDLVIFRANTIHAGAGYADGHFARLHCYADSHYVKRQIGRAHV